MYALGFHAIVSVQNLILYLICILSKKIVSCENLSMATDLDFCALTVDQTEETCLFTQSLLFYINNLFQLSLHNFKKVFNL